MFLRIPPPFSTTLTEPLPSRETRNGSAPGIEQMSACNKMEKVVIESIRFHKEEGGRRKQHPLVKLTRDKDVSACRRGNTIRPWKR